MNLILQKTVYVLKQKMIATCCLRRFLRTRTNIQIIERLISRPLFNVPSFNYHSILKNHSSEIGPGKNCANRVFYSNLPDNVDSVDFETICAETLDSLCEWFDDVIESTPTLKSADVTFGDGVLTVNLGTFGTYVINRQSPNKQIWLSSPTSGPKRYDFVPDRKGWVYRHDNKTLHHLLQTEMSAIIKSPVDLSHCSYFSN